MVLDRKENSVQPGGTCFPPPALISMQQLESNHKSLLNSATLHQHGFLRNKKHVVLYTERLPSDTELRGANQLQTGKTTHRQDFICLSH